MTVDQFFKHLKEIKGKWRLHSGSAIRLDKPYSCPVCAVANHLGHKYPFNGKPYSLGFELATKAIELDPVQAHLIAMAADHADTPFDWAPMDPEIDTETMVQAYRKRLLSTLNLQES